jgi:UDP-N-acetylmuramoyl-L-alanyl-D-glutamate--2,6-diaminopimelate ligase
MSAATSGIAALLTRAEPSLPRPLGQLADRLQTEGRLRGARTESGPIGVAAVADVEIRGIAYDSRAVLPGSLFVAVPGAHVDGHDFLVEAQLAGAAAALVERPVAGVALPQLVVDRSQTALATTACWWYGDPSRELGVVGITGTDGKTTTSFLAVAALEATGLSTGLVGTVDTKIGTVREANPEHATTPEAPVLQASPRAMVNAGNEAAVIETTSHGLALERVGGIAYDAAVVTNLTHEHLEFHGSWEAYRDAKLSLFERLRAGPANPSKDVRGGRWPKLAVVNLDDPSAGQFAGVAQEAGARVLTYGTERAADVRATRVEENADGLRMTIATPSGETGLALRMAGRFNAHNALAVVALAEGLGLERDAVVGGIESVDGVPGRMERVDAGQPFEVVIDYAHSPASLTKVIDLLAPVAAARGGGLIAVFGSAGERDTEKRPMMGRIAGEHCRLVVVTDEDPRGEDRAQILEDIAAGAEAAGRRREHDLLLIPDRAAAIEAALERARPGDVVLLAGKGHERSIIGPRGPAPWDERDAALDALSALGYGLRSRVR